MMVATLEMIASPDMVKRISERPATVQVANTAILARLTAHCAEPPPDDMLAPHSMACPKCRMLVLSLK